MSKIKKSELLQALKADVKEAERHQKDWMVKRETWLSETYGQPYGNEEDGKSKIVSKDIKKQLEWMLPSLTDPFLSTSNVIKCNPVTFEDAHAARQNELLLNTQFCRKFDRYNFIMKAVRVLIAEGTVVVQTGWDYEDEEIESMVESIGVNDDGDEFVEMQKTTVTRIKRNQPTAMVCRNEDIFIDPTCMDDMDKCQFVVHRYQTSLSALKADGRYKNLDRVSQERPTLMSEPQYYREDLTFFEFKDEPRKKFVINEYWGYYDVNGDGEVEPIVCSWIGNTIVRLETNPYPDKKPPFIIVPFTAVPFQMFGEAMAETIGDNQKIKTAITRGIIDNMARSNNGQVGIQRGTLDMANRKKFLQGKNFEYTGSPNSFWQGNFNEIPNSAFNMINLMNNEIEAQTGVKSFSGGITGQALGQMLDITTDIPMFDGSTKKLEHIVDGDILIGSNGKATTVVKAHEIKFPEQAYNMTFDGRTVVKAGGEHLWTVKVFGTDHSLREWHTADTDTIYAHMQAGRRVVIPKIKEVYTGTKATSTIDPYVLGYWLGDRMSHAARITTADLEVVTYFNEAGYTCVEVKDSSKTGNAKMYDVYKTGYTPERDATTGQFIGNGSLHSELKELGLMARYDGCKHIPEMFMKATYEEKMELIRGLMDSDGYAHSGSFVQFTQSEGRLKDDFIALIKSLGLKPSIVKRNKDTRNALKIAAAEKNSDTQLILSTKDSYEIGFTPWSNPFKLLRKASKWKPPKTQTVRLSSMEKTDKVLMRCLTVDSEDHLYAVTTDMVLTHNTATGVRGALDATSSRRLNLVRNIAENLVKPLMRKWMSYNSEFLEEEEIIRVTNEQFIPIRRDDLDGRIDIDISINTAEDNAAKSQEISFLLQTVGPNEDPTIRRELMAQILELMRMPEQAEKLRNYQPQPDPMQQQLQQLQMQQMMLEMEKLKAEIADKYARAGENQIDAEVKKAKAEVEKAKARKLGSEADTMDLDFLMKDQGVDQMRDMQKQQNAMNMMQMKHDMDMQKAEHGRLSKLDMEAAKATFGERRGQL